MERIWLKIKDQKKYFDDLSFGHAELWIGRCLLPNTRLYLIGNAGLLMLSDITPPICAYIHYFMWEKVDAAFGAKAMKEAFKITFEDFKLQRVGAMVPSFNQDAKRAALISGFRFEGTIRRTVLMDGKFYDMDLFGVIKEEYEARKSRRVN
jgi:RimJ/RimL family protein N-acetyltransferase